MLNPFAGGSHSNRRLPRVTLIVLALLMFTTGCSFAAAPTIAPVEGAPSDEPSAPAPSATPEQTPTVQPDTPTPTATASQAPTAGPTAVLSPTHLPENAYLTQEGETIFVVSQHFKVSANAIRCPDGTPPYCFDDESGEALFNPNRILPTGTVLLMPNGSIPAAPAEKLLPNSEVIYTHEAESFDIQAFLSERGGSLGIHRQYLMLNGWNSGADIIRLVAVENSINPRLLIALLEYQCGCVDELVENPEPYMGVQDTLRHDLYGQLIWAIHNLSNGYYGWRWGYRDAVQLVDGTVIELDPSLNPGTAALYHFFGNIYGEEDFNKAIDLQAGFPALYREMFGDPWEREKAILTEETQQPEFQLPFEPGLIWSYTGGPHPAYEGNGPFASLDFAPSSAGQGCLPSTAWVTAVADGLILRTEYGTVIQDLDGDGSEQTGWNVMYLHVGEEDRVEAGQFVRAGEKIGHPTCEGGVTTGTHLHIARKYNGEWIPAGSGPMPFNLGGWVAVDGEVVYKGFLVRGETILTACTCSWRESWIENE